MRTHLSLGALFICWALATTAVAAPTMIPSTFKDVAKKVRPSVVNISTVKNVRIPGMRFGGGGTNNPAFDEFYKRFFGEIPRDQFMHSRSLGSGVIIDATRGLVLTNNHVIEDADEIKVKLHDKREFDAKVLGRDPKTDLAVVQIKGAKDLSAAVFGDSDAIDVGDWVLAVGSPFGLEQTVSHGIISAKGRVIGAGPYDDFLQTDAPINPGNSGGPLVDLDGAVIGINTAIASTSGANDGVGFAIPSSVARHIYRDLADRGSVTRGWLGVQIQDLDEPLRKYFSLPKDLQGIAVSNVIEKGPADDAGLQHGDVILEIDSKQVGAVRELQRKVADTPVGQTLNLKIWRAKNVKTVRVKVGDMKDFDTEVKLGQDTMKAAGRLGLRVRDLKPEERSKAKIPLGEGVRVEEVTPNSVAAGSGIQVGDIMLELNKQIIRNAVDLAKAAASLKAGEPSITRVQRDGRNLYLTLRLPIRNDAENPDEEAEP